MGVNIKLNSRWLLLVTIVVLGLLLRLYQANYNFDGDEVFSVELASQSFMEMISGSLEDRPHPPLHILSLYLWIKLFGPSELSARMLSIVFSCFFLMLSHAMLCKIIDRWLALGILSILAFSPLFIYFGQQARPYALIACLSSYCLYSFLRIIEKPSDRIRVLVWALSCALLVYAQYLGVLLIFFQIILAFFMIPANRMTVVIGGVGGSSLILPWFVIAMSGPVLDGVDPLQQISWMVSPSLLDFVWFYIGIFSEGPSWLQSRWLLIILLLIGSAYMLHLIRKTRLPAEHVLFILVGIGMPLLVFGISVLGPKPIFAPRQLLGAAVAFVVLVGLCLATMPRAFALGITAVLLAWTIAGIPQAFPRNTKPPWKEMLAFIDDSYGTTTPIVAQESWITIPMMHYSKSKKVYIWNKLPEKEVDTYIFVCRPTGSRCSRIEAEKYKKNSEIVATYYWGGRQTAESELRIYKYGRLK